MLIVNFVLSWGQMSQERIAGVGHHHNDGHNLIGAFVSALGMGFNLVQFGQNDKSTHPKSSLDSLVSTIRTILVEMLIVQSLISQILILL
ncbi:hypothetical protein L484_007220 [Morus notabilis]|uniref:Uncharacterized protein n=1 Tax=Morus notabilis TaxID=981085 RepID=W9RG18_9ROSA|nr:hypothetical protein L484_007220 [Morus notabilis]